MDDILLESWDRQTRILTNLISLITPDVLQARPSADGMPIIEQVCHIHEVRYGWLGKVSPTQQATVGEVLREADGQWIPIEDFEEIKRQLGLSAAAVREAVREALEKKVTTTGPYSHPAFFIQHMCWHEGYHFALILLALRMAGVDPTDEWEEENVWGIWRS